MYHYFLYHSRASAAQSVNQDVLNILRTSVPNNQALGITGLLVLEAGRYFQYLEGDQQTVYSLYERIKRDDRHHAIFLVAQGTHTQRLFPDFEMGFQNTAKLDIKPSDCLDDRKETPRELLSVMRKLADTLRRPQM